MTHKTVALITGANKGLGLEIARQLGKQGLIVVLGARDEAKMVGDIGHCGGGLCCRKFLPKFSSITGETAEVQKLSGRGSERLSGACGRLMCCLEYEHGAKK